ncbi:cytochrome c biogenesis protein CcdA [Nocardia sp. 2]|uniref:Cytochrome c biogenesis protein CcdA n=1 Tax=Nocardia acididurans TaxID=2802282 RepID=A0ABS1M692_9NOCA|nr:cytochrome c biogenesis protein CcdA [Nocardia acididurans]
MGSIGFLAAFLGGLLALVSPCSALLLPSFFAYSFGSRGRLLARTWQFYLGLATTLVPLGIAGSFASKLFYGHRELLIAIGGWTIITLGVLQIVGRGFSFGFAQRAAARIGRPERAGAVYLLGLVYGLAGFCAGPILGSILTVAAVSGNPVHGGLLLAVYALGMAVPLFVLALLWDRFDLGRRGWLRGRTLTAGRVRLHTTSLLSGLFFIALGVLFLMFDGTSALPGVLSTDTEFALETWVLDVSDRVSRSPLALAGAAVLLVGVAWRLLRGGSDAAADDAMAAGETVPELTEDTTRG